MFWCRPGDKRLSEPMMVSLSTHICPNELKQNSWKQIKQLLFFLPAQFCITYAIFYCFHTLNLFYALGSTHASIMLNEIFTFCCISGTLHCKDQMASQPSHHQLEICLFKFQTDRTVPITVLNESLRDPYIYCKHKSARTIKMISRSHIYHEIQ